MVNDQTDNPELDNTPFAHPAFIRGQDDCVKVMCHIINNILNGNDDGRGVSNEPWESTRRRLLELVNARK
jgi:hypothetical protein